jgi:DivIVA domain-containing protein
VKSEDVANKEFPMALRGYSRLEVRLFLSELAREMAERDGHLNRLEAEFARARAELTAAEKVGRAGLLRHLGAETASILEAADASAARMRADAEATAHRVREGLRTVSQGLGDVHQLMGELVGLVQTMVDDPGPAPPPPSFNPLDYERSLSTVPRFTGDHDVEILLPDDGGPPHFR